MSLPRMRTPDLSALAIASTKQCCYNGTELVATMLYLLHTTNTKSLTNTWFIYNSETLTIKRLRHFTTRTSLTFPGFLWHFPQLSGHVPCVFVACATDSGFVPQILWQVPQIWGHVPQIMGHVPCIFVAPATDFEACATDFMACATDFGTCATDFDSCDLCFCGMCLMCLWHVPQILGHVPQILWHIDHYCCC